MSTENTAQNTENTLSTENTTENTQDTESTESTTEDTEDTESTQTAQAAPRDELGQVWTPHYIAEEMLDEIGYTVSNKDILTQKIMEPAFGEGVFLYEIIRRLIACCVSQGKSVTDIESILNENIYAIEYDDALYETVLDDITEWLDREYGLQVSLDNVLCADALDTTLEDTVDYVVGNPPYIRVHNMPDGMRRKVRDYAYTTGTTDLYIVFFEIGLRMLHDDGVLAYITPNTWLRNMSQRSFRKRLMTERQVSKIVNFNSDQVFSGVGTYTCITYLQHSEADVLSYVDSKADLTVNYTREIPYDAIDPKISDTLTFPDSSDQKILDRRLYSDGDSLGSRWKVQNGVGTQGNSCYLVKGGPAAALGTEDHVHPAVKGSTYKGGDITEKIIFPYRYRDGAYRGLSEEELAERSPVVYDILRHHREQLSARVMSDDLLWFWYGRSQSIQAVRKEKVVLSHTLSPRQNTVQAYLLPEDVVVYSGIVITASEGGDPLSDVLEVLESDDFIRYCRIVGKDMSGGYKAITTSMLKKYRL